MWKEKNQLIRNFLIYKYCKWDPYLLLISIYIIGVFNLLFNIHSRKDIRVNLMNCQFGFKWLLEFLDITTWIPPHTTRHEVEDSSMLHNNFFADEIGNMVVSARTGSHYIQHLYSSFIIILHGTHDSWTRMVHSFLVLIPYYVGSA